MASIRQWTQKNVVENDMKKRFSEFNAVYLGGWVEYPAQKNIVLRITDSGLEAISLFLRKKLFCISWNAIADVGQNLKDTQEASALGGVMTGMGLLGAGNPGQSVNGQLSALSLTTAGANMRSNKTEHFLHVQYQVSGVKGIAVFQFEPWFFRKQPVLQVIAVINQFRIERQGKKAV